MIKRCVFMGLVLACSGVSSYAESFKVDNALVGKYTYTLANPRIIQRHQPLRPGINDVSVNLNAMVIVNIKSAVGSSIVTVVQRPHGSVECLYPQPDLLCKGYGPHAVKLVPLVSSIK